MEGLQHSAVGSNGKPAAAEPDVTLTLHITDPEVVRELQRRAAGAERDEYAVYALRLGVLALRQASGSIDVEHVRAEGERIVTNVQTMLAEQTGSLTTRLNATIAH